MSVQATHRCVPWRRFLLTIAALVIDILLLLQAGRLTPRRALNRTRYLICLVRR